MHTSFSIAALALIVCLEPATPLARTVPATQSDSLRAAHVLNRLTFGARPGDLETVMAMGVDRWINAQLNPETISDSSTFTQAADAPPSRNTKITAVTMMGDTITNMTADQLKGMALKSVRHTVNMVFSLPVDPAILERISRNEASERQLLEVVTDFWLNHFSVYRAKMPAPDALRQFATTAVRPNALGKFRDLLGAVAQTIAMVFYLDNHLNSADSTHLTLTEYSNFLQTGRRTFINNRGGPNENYARELLELHTMGVDGGYTQRDVIEVARALSGWTIDVPFETGAFRFDPNMHDAEAKTVLGRDMAAGRGVEDGNEVLDILARHPATARFIARKLAVRFVSDTPPDALVERAAATFIRTDGDIREVLRTIVTSAEFFAPETFRAKVRSPAELILGMRRAISDRSDKSRSTLALMNELSQSPWGKEAPDGWSETAAPWLSSGAMFNRVGIAVRIAAGEVADFSPDSSAAWRALADSSFQLQMDAVIRIVLGGSASPETRAALMKSQASNYPNGATQETRRVLKDLLAIALGSPEFQRR